MLFVLLNFAISISKTRKIQIHGNWSDSNAIDEAIVFFEKTKSQYSQVLTNNYEEWENMSKDEIIDNMKTIIDPQLLGLLNLSLSFRIFHPIASIRKPNLKNIPILRGYGVRYETKTSMLPIPDIGKRLLSMVYDEKLSDMDRIFFLKKFSNHFGSVYHDVLTHNINNSLLNMHSPKLSSHETLVTLINGRVSPLEPHLFTRTMIEEYIFFQMFNTLGFENDLTSHIMSNQVFRAVPYFLEPADVKYSAKLRDMENSFQSENMPLVFNPKAAYDSFYNVRINIINSFVYIKIGSQESKPLLQTILDELHLQLPICVSVFPIFDSSNDLELFATMGFYLILDKNGPRHAIEYLLQGLNIGYEASYKKQKISLPWKKMDDLMHNPLYMDRISYLSEYYKQKKINTTTVLVNGIPIMNNPIHTCFNEMLSDFYPLVKTIAEKYSFRNYGELINSFREYCIIIGNINNSILSSSVSYIDLSHHSLDSINTTLNILSSSKPLINSSNTSPIPIFIFNCSNRIGFESFVHTVKSVSSMECLEVYIVEGGLGPEMLIPQKTSFMIGGQLFDKYLDLDELIIKIKSYKAAFNITYDQISPKQRIFLHLWQSHHAKFNIHRMNSGEIDGNWIKAGSGSIKITSLVDPFDIEFQYSSEVMVLAIENNIAEVDLKILPGFSSSTTSLPAHFSTKYQFIVCNDYIEIPTTDFDLIKPDCWITKPIDEGFIVNNITFSGFSVGNRYIKIGDQYRRTQKTDNFFFVNLPIGIYKTEGLIQDKFYADSLVPLPIFLDSNNQEVVLPEKDGKLHVFTFVSGKQYESLTLTMMYSLVSQSTLPVKFYIIGSFSKEIPIKYDIEFLPPILPPGIIEPTSYVSKLRIAKITIIDTAFPANVEHVLFADPGVVWKDNAARFSLLNLKNAVIALPDISSDPQVSKKSYFMSENMITQRQKRPFHSTSLFYVNVEKWRDLEVISVVQHLYMMSLKGWKKFHSIDNDILNELQFQIQVMTLPAETAYCNVYSSPKRLGSAVSVVLCSKDSAADIGCHYDDLLNKSLSD